jgi:hypothetical protein
MIEYIAGYALSKLIEEMSNDGPRKPPLDSALYELIKQKQPKVVNIGLFDQDDDLPGARRISKDELRDMWYRNEITSDEYFSLLSKYD